ncbi:unnamed protein product [Protopolystoma xenopodis]|uniref:Uncharacterized protein n=1 Tax=Protopolystoma xenopodis TaxID=117903 RepID=A0A3S4ZML5_9PLAT|nr:unnamed protein product [Protopolystoma xenopodis]
MAKLTDDAGEKFGNVPSLRSDSVNYHAYYGPRTRNMFPQNIIQSCLQQQQSVFVNKTRRLKKWEIDMPTELEEEVTEVVSLVTAAIVPTTNLAPPRISYEAVKAEYVESTNVLGMQ